MKLWVKAALIGGSLAILAAMSAWWWHNNMQLQWQREPRQSPLAAGQPFLGATWLLRENGFAVDVVPSLDLVDVRKLRNGTLLLGGSAGVITQAKSDQLLAWVAAGNTLVFQPRALNKEEKRLLQKAGARGADAEEESEDDEAAGEDAQDAPDDAAARAARQGGDSAPEDAAEAEAESEAETEPDEEDAAEATEEEEEEEEPAGPVLKANETDGLAAVFNARSAHKYQQTVCSTLSRRLEPAHTPEAYKAPCPPGTVKAASLRLLDLPGMGELTLDPQSVRVRMLDERRVPLWTDNQLDGIRAYQHGRGQVVMAPGALFENHNLRQHDHGALLVGLARLNGAHKQVTIVKSRITVPWYALLWLHYKKVIIALAALLGLLFWASVRRFGPVLPDPAPARRSLMEHISASGAWLWKAKGGRQVLVDAARADLQATLQRRAPGLLRLSETQQHDELARLTGLSAAVIAHAMHYEPATAEAEFTRQIRTLQTLRKHYER
ncbi:DUF4350 domain-containing protein [Massilia sp. PAMC28688]|uniref:DUF4350 domain-containing protein n=1 Tax=Massilia sp. PAMC28688 TaxID=2861283 RepID=UPI001C626303|nr:DUF4350 domain-containing protein [Massilia sp. PAMC28688]QYF93665.1 DUF4350 domain-containing protein [Massilia sp. PAMC28688]